MALRSRSLALFLITGLSISAGAMAATPPTTRPAPPRAATGPLIRKNVILIKGATPSASDSVMPLPESGKVADGRYRNAYFGMTYPIPSGWNEGTEGPPPSDSGSYVLGQFILHDREENRLKGNLLITAQDLFFSVIPVAGAAELIKSLRGRLSADYTVESEPASVEIGGYTFSRFSYGSPLAQLHWRVVSTDVRCHVVTFTFAGHDTEALDAAEKQLSGMKLDIVGDRNGKSQVPHCVADYATGANIIEKVDPHLTDHHFNPIPVRIVIDKEGHVKHVHLLSAFPEQADTIMAALRKWHFKPYLHNGKPAEVETGIVFGLPRRTAPASAHTAPPA